MALMDVSSGVNVPNNINVVIEIPRYSEPVKYEVDKETGALFVDRFMGTAMRYPHNYGYIPHTLSEDGDPVDVLVIAPNPVISGSVIRCRPIGVLKMVDESGTDAKILAVPNDDLTTYYTHINTFRDLPQAELQKISHFFEHYKDLETGKWVKIDGWFGLEEAKEEIISSMERYSSARVKPVF